MVDNQLKIDLVYLWVDSSDDAWREKKEYWENKSNIEKTANSKCRYFNNDELKYSLRSVEKYAPWINHIYIVTDNQVPEWLDITNPKISVIDHKNIIPNDALPTFNSIAIENCIINIPNLSEYFLYANDDMFFAKSTSPEFFYNEKGYPICRFGRLGNKKYNDLYHDIIKNSQNLIKEKYGYEFINIPHHCIDAYRKSDILECQKIFKEDIEKTIYSKFRTIENIERIIYLYYACVIGHGEFKVVKKVDEKLSFFQRIFRYLIKKYEKDSLLITVGKDDIRSQIKKLKPYLLCINDNELTTDHDRKDMFNFMNEFFSEKSSFEKEVSRAEN